MCHTSIRSPETQPKKNGIACLEYYACRMNTDRALRFVSRNMIRGLLWESKSRLIATVRWTVAYHLLLSESKNRNVHTSSPNGYNQVYSVS
jgi:hypothetical protein